MSHITRAQALRLARESAYPRTANNPMEAQSLIGIDEMHKLCNAAIQHYIDSAALAQPEPPAVAFDDPKVQIVYDLLCSDEVPPPQEHWEGFTARRIIDALSAQPEPVALKWTQVEEWWESGNEDFDKLKDAVMQMLAAAKGGDK